MHTSTHHHPTDAVPFQYSPDDSAVVYSLTAPPRHKRTLITLVAVAALTLTAGLVATFTVGTAAADAPAVSVSRQD